MGKNKSGSSNVTHLAKHVLEKRERARGFQTLGMVIVARVTHKKREPFYL